MRTTYDISLVVDGLTFADDELDRLFNVLPDALSSSVGGLVTISAPIEADGPEAACVGLADAITDVLTYVRVVRVDQDYVSIPDIADRTDRSRESIRLLVEGKRGPGAFPAPAGIIGGGSRFWPWSQVVAWFSTEMGLDLGYQGVPPETAAIVDARLAGIRQTV